MVAQRRKVKAGVRVETLEGRVVLSSVAHPAHAPAIHSPQAHVAAVHTTAHQNATIPNPVLVNLTPGVTGIQLTDVSFDPRVNVISVKGTIDIVPTTALPYEGYTPTFPESNYVGISATQAITRFQSVSGFQYVTATIPDATTTQIPFQGRVVASSGKFQSGLVTLSITSSNSNIYSYVTLSVVAHMRKAKAY